MHRASIPQVPWGGGTITPPARAKKGSRLRNSVSINASQIITKALSRPPENQGKSFFQMITLSPGGKVQR